MSIAERRFTPRSLLFALAAMLACSQVARSEVERLPAVSAEVEGPAAQQASDAWAAQAEESEPILDLESQPAEIPAKSPLQWAGVTLTWLPADQPDDLGMTDIDLTAIFALPCPTEDSPLVLTPAFGVHYLSGPNTADLPPRVYDGTFDIRWINKITPAFATDLSVTPGWHSDFEQSDSAALRIDGRALGIWTASPAMQFVTGVLYLDRDETRWLPAGGVIWTPDPDTRYELIFPQPKLSWRLEVNGKRETWGYLAGEFGRGIWAIERSDDTHDLVRYRDLRIILGSALKGPGGPKTRFEIGYVFSREIEFASAAPDVDVSGTWLLRTEVAY